LPAEVGELIWLDLLGLNDNELVSLPPDVGRLQDGCLLNLIGNDPLNSPPMSVCTKGAEGGGEDNPGHYCVPFVRAYFKTAGFDVPMARLTAAQPEPDVGTESDQPEASAPISNWVAGSFPKWPGQKVEALVDAMESYDVYDTDDLSQTTEEDVAAIVSAAAMTPFAERKLRTKVISLRSETSLASPPTAAPAAAAPALARTLSPIRIASPVF
jgi:hypothetical protein